MLEIRFTLDASTALIGALQDLAGAIRAAANPVMPISHGNHCGPLMPRTSPADLREGTEKDGTAEKAPNLPSEAPVEAERSEAPEIVEEPKKRKPRAKKAPSESNTPFSPAVGDNSSPVGEAEPERAATEETNAQETAPETDPDPVPEAPAPVEEAPAAQAEDPLAGKGQTGEILAALTRKAIGDLDALGVDRGDANRRIRDYCSRNEIKFPTFPALLQAVGYADAIAICKGA